MININKFSITMLDLKNSAIIASPSIDEITYHESSFLLSKVKKVLANIDNRQCELNENSKFIELLNTYKNTMDINQITETLSKMIFDKKLDMGISVSSDLIVIDFDQDGHQYLLIYDHSLENEFSHYIESYNGESRVRITREKAVLSRRIKKGDTYFLIDCTENTYMVYDANIMETKEDVSGTVFESIFDIQAKQNDKDIIETLEESVTIVAEQHELNQMECAVALKKELLSSPDIDLSGVSDLVFYDNEEAKESFQVLVEERELPKELSINKTVLKKKDKYQKIITDIGVEINIPVKHLSEKDKVEIVHNQDGTTSINIRNINVITDK